MVCADIGSVKKGRFGWARVQLPRVEPPYQASSIRELVESLAHDLVEGVPVALGLECPLFVPIPADPTALTSARRGEGNRPWSAGAGAAALATGLTETVWILQEVRRVTGTSCEAYVDWQEFSTAGAGLFLWEAFVTGASKSTGEADSHAADALIACEAFASALPDPRAVNAIDEPQVHSLLGAALLRSGWSTDVGLLSAPCLVVRG